MAKLTRNGMVGLELTREEVIDIRQRVIALARKAECREVNCVVLDLLEHIQDELAAVDEKLTNIIEDGEEDINTSSSCNYNPEKSKLIHTPLSSTNLSGCLINPLNEEHIYTIWDLVKLSYRDLTRIKRLGKISARSAKDFVEEFGLWLGMSDAEIKEWMRL